MIDACFGSRGAGAALRNEWLQKEARILDSGHDGQSGQQGSFETDAAHDPGWGSGYEGDSGRARARRFWAEALLENPGGRSNRPKASMVPPCTDTIPVAEMIAMLDEA